MNQNKTLTGTLYVLAMLLIICGGWLAGTHYRPATKPKPNNQYEILVYQDHFVLKDGDRIVKVIKVEEDKVLDSLIVADNQ